MTTHTVTLNLPEKLYQRLRQRSQQFRRSLEDELLLLLASKASEFETGSSASLAYNEVIEFLGRGATTQEIVDFRLSAAAQARGQALLEKNRQGTLSPAEEAELNLYIELENLMALIKIRAHQQLRRNL
jgi:plasmid stability protein